MKMSGKCGHRTGLIMVLAPSEVTDEDVEDVERVWYANPRLLEKGRGRRSILMHCHADSSLQDELIVDDLHDMKREPTTVSLDSP